MVELNFGDLSQENYEVVRSVFEEWRTVKKQEKEGFCELQRLIAEEVRNRSVVRRAELIEALGSEPVVGVEAHIGLEEIVDFSFREGVDPRWLYQHVNSTAGRVRRYGGSLRNEEEFNNAYDYYLAAISAITKYGDNPKLGSMAAGRYAAVAKEMSLAEERLEEVNRLERRSAFYGFFEENVYGFAEIAKDHFWDNY